MISPEHPVCEQLARKDHCHLECYSNSPLIVYLYAGLALLNESGKISPLQSIAPRTADDASTPSRSHPRKDAFLRVKIDQQIAIHFDVHDCQSVDQPIAESVDVYFKRSYSAEAIDSRFHRRIIPLGLAYQLYRGGVD